MMVSCSSVSMILENFIDPYHSKNIYQFVDSYPEYDSCLVPDLAGRVAGPSPRSRSEEAEICLLSLTECLRSQSGQSTRR